MKKIFNFLITAYFFFFFTVPTYAQIGLNAKNQPGGVKINNDNPDDLLGLVFKNTIILFFTVGGIGFTIMFLWGAVDWILSGGDKEKIAGARKRIITAITGLALLSLTFVISVVIGQIFGLESLRQFEFKIPKLTN